MLGRYPRLRLRRRWPGCEELEAALRRLAASRDQHIELLVDLTPAGTEAAVLDALRRHGLGERAVLSSQCRPILGRLRELDASARIGISVAGRLSRRVQHCGAWRDEVLEELRRGAATPSWCSADSRAALVERVRDAGAQIHASTVRASADVVAPVRSCVDGIVTTDPRFVA